MNGVEVGQSFDLRSSAPLCASMERFLPEVLSGRHPEWAFHNLDGSFIATAVREGMRRALIAGTCIVISDQRLAPFRFEVTLSQDRVAWCQVRLGEAGDGVLGIAGAPYGSRRADALLHTLVDRM